MAIKNPNPNIKDFEVNDNTTWSSAHIAEGLQAAGVDVGAGGSVDPVKASLIKTITTEEALSSIEITGLNHRFLLIVVNLNYAATTSVTSNVRIKTDTATSYKYSPACFNRSLTGGSDYIAFYVLDCTKGVTTGYGYINASNGYTNIMALPVTSSPIDNVITDVELRYSAAAPTGTTVTVYGY